MLKPPVQHDTWYSDVILDPQWSKDRGVLENSAAEEGTTEVQEDIVIAETSLPEARISLEGNCSNFVLSQGNTAQTARPSEHQHA